ncbi:MAG: methyltransferase domain-containing protein [Alphaproteobacteria bacterium]|nr:methyltransferase domain-containing protein [Alphaproteobacteria bacterium]
MNEKTPFEKSSSDSVYSLRNVSLFETIYGKNLISIGGFDSVEYMFSDLETKNLNALDIGFGLGGIAFYLAKNHQMKISGVEVHPWMVKYAYENAPKDIAPQLSFAVYDDQGQIPYHAESFDMVYSKGVLNHVRDKASLFQQVNTVLKPAGLFVITDWIFPQSAPNNAGPLVHETQESYRQVLQNAGFHEISFRNDSKMFLGYVQDLLKNLEKCKMTITQEYGEDLFSGIWNQHQDLIKDIQNDRKFSMRILAKKSAH